jgi:thiol-disulfide isomerase/thioredoxin
MSKTSFRRLSLRGGATVENLSGTAAVKVFGSDVELLKQDGTKAPASTVLAGKKVIGLYFSAHWCPPCRGFTPRLAEAYKTISAEKAFEIVFISSDRNDEAFTSYFKEMPWLALPFSESELKQKLSEKHGVDGIPTLVLIDGESGDVISQDGRSVVTSDPTGARFPWVPGGEIRVFGERTPTYHQMKAAENDAAIGSLSAEEAGLVAQIAGCWKPAREDGSDWMKGMTISEDGTFCTKWDGKQHQVQDGRVRVVSAEDRRINLRRTCDNPNDHVFTVDADFKRMKGECPQSGCTYTLTRAAGVEDADESQESERWDDDSRPGDEV